MISDEQLLKAKILVVDDQELSVRLISSILKKAAFVNIFSTTDSRQASKLYQEIHPDLVVLDLNMPHLTGFDVMEQLKALEGGSYVPIIVLSNEESQEARFQALQSGAKDFLNKPYDPVEVIIRIRNLIEVRMLQNEIKDQNKQLETKVKVRTRELYDTQLDVIQRLARAVEYRDSETGLHIVRMSYYCATLADKVGFGAGESDIMLTASPLHDVGKIGIPDRILRKAGPLTAEEWLIMKSHTTIGAEMLSGSSSKYLIMAREIALTHHEKWDGSGYPQGLKGENIPISGRICGLCDVYDALMTKRPYKRAWTKEETLAEIKKGKGTHFDPNLVDCFFSVLPEIERIKDDYQDSQTDNNLESKEK